MISPRQQLVDAVDFMLGNLAENFRQPRLRVDLVELRRLDERIGHRCGTVKNMKRHEPLVFSTINIVKYQESRKDMITSAAIRANRRGFTVVRFES